MFAKFLTRAAVIAGVIFSAPAAAETDQQMHTLMSADEARAWQAVGRLELADAGFCTGAMIAPNLVLTAAHCMFDPVTGQRLDPTKIKFLAGWRQGRAVAYRGARRSVVHASYIHTGTAEFDKVANDIAIVELDQPIRNATIAPFDRSNQPNVGEMVQVVSYAKGRSEIPSLQDRCEVLGLNLTVLVLSCEVAFGASGSPIFVIENGVPKIASVVSAKATLQERDVALGTSLGQPLEELLTQLSASNGVFRGKKPSGKSLSEQLGRTSSASFLRSED